MQEFWAYLQIGFEHFLDLGAPDHILFVLMLALPYQWKDWRRLTVLVSAFTVGHSLTLALALYTEPAPSFLQWIEFLIAFSIAFTAMLNLRSRPPKAPLFLLITFFGLIHGYGFSATLKNLLLHTEFSLWNTLLPFNLGLELAQILWILMILGLRTLLSLPRYVPKTLTLATLFISLYWMLDRFPL